MRKQYSFFFLATILPLLLIYGLYRYDLKGYASLKTGFKRKLTPSLQLQKQASINLAPNRLIKIAGITGDCCYFLSRDRLRLFVYNFTSRQLDTVLESQKRITQSVLAEDSLLITTTDSSYVYSVNKSRLQLQYTKKLVLNFDKAVRISPGILAGRYPADSGYAQMKLGLLTPDGQLLKADSGVTENIKDGGLSTDGFLCRSQQSFFYIYHYGSRVAVFDSTMVLKETRQTIDYLDKGLPRVLNDSSKKTFYFGEPRRFTHLTGFASDKYLFIVSTLKASNELLSVFRSSLVVDMYHSSNMAYRQSFYINNEDINKLQDAVIAHNRLYLLFQNKLNVYESPGLF